MTMAEREALRDFSDHIGGFSGIDFDVEELVTVNISVTRLARLTPDKLRDYVIISPTEAGTLIKAAKVFPLACGRLCMVACMHAGAFYARCGRP